MKKMIAALSTFIAAALPCTVSASAAGASPAAGDPGWWVYALLALVAVAIVVALVVTGKKKK